MVFDIVPDVEAGLQQCHGLLGRAIDGPLVASATKRKLPVRPIKHV